METPQVGVLSEPDLPRPDVLSTGAAENIQAAGTSIAEVIGERRLSNATEGLVTELDNETNQWWDETKNTKQPVSVVDVFNVDEESFNAAPEPVKALMSEIARQKAAAEQGAISGTELKVRHEAKLREYLNKYPQFTPELQAASGQALGYNPLGAHIDAMMETLQGKESNAAAEWAELDRYADAVGVDMTLKSIDPVGYYSQMMAFANRDTEYNYLARELNITKVVKEGRNIAEMEQFQKTVGAKIMGHASGLANSIIRRVRATDIGGKGAFGVDTIHQIRNEVAAFNQSTRISIQRDFPEMSQEQINAYMAPIEKNLELVLRSTDLGEMQTALNLFKTQATAQVYADHPDVVNLEIAANILKDMPNIPGLIEKKNLTGAFSAMVHNLVGGGNVPIVGATGLGIVPSTMNPADRSSVYNGLVDGMPIALDKAKAEPKYYPVIKRMAIQQFEFLDRESEIGTGGDEKANKKFISFWSDPESAKVISQGGRVPGEDKLINNAVTFAALMVRREGAKDIKAFDQLRDSNVPGRLLNMSPGGGAAMPATINDIMEMTMEGGNVHFSANWSNVGLDPNKVPPSTKAAVDRQLKQAELTFGKRMSDAIKMIAHIQGSTNYSAVASRYSEELKAPVIEALLMPNG